jgi:hypothetical protein
MNKKIEVFVHLNGGEPRKIAIDEQETIGRLLQEAAPHGHAELDVFVDDKHHEHDRRLCDAGVRHHHHVHCRNKAHESREVKISINGKEYETARGKNSVEHIRKLGHVPATDILSELKHNVPVDLPNDGFVHIHGGEVFVSHVPSAGSA